MDLILVIRWYKAKSARHPLPPTIKAGRRTRLVSFNHFLQLTTVVWVTWWGADCPQSPCIAATSLPLFMTKRRAAAAPHFITRSNATAQWCMELVSLPDSLLAGTAQQTCKRGSENVCFASFKLHWNFYFLSRVSQKKKKGLNVCKCICIMKIAVL